MSRKRWIQLGVVVMLLVAWRFCNRPGRFGWSCYAFTIYNSWPRPIGDLQIRADGQVRKIAKTHDLQRDQIAWLLEEKPDVLIVAIGWDGVVEPAENVRRIEGRDVRVLKNKEAIDLFNSLKRAGRRVAIHYHSTC